MKLLSSVSVWMVTAAIVVGSSTAEATHFRGVDMWASIDNQGVVTLTMRTRWRKNRFSASGVDPARFGETSFTCTPPLGGATITGTVSPATNMQIKRASDGAVMLTYPTNAFTFTSFTTATDETPDQYSERTQVFKI